MYNFDEPFNRRNTNCWKWDGEGKGLELAMGCADTDFRIAQPIAEALKNKIDEGALTHPVNNQKTREALKGYFARHYKIEISEEWICDSVGMMNGLRLILEALTHVGDRIIIQSPVFNYFNDTVENAGRQISDNHMSLNEETGCYEIDFDTLQSMALAPTAKIMLICNPVNPTGRIYSRDELLRISDICRDNDVLLISDEVHADFYFDGTQHTSALSLPTEYLDNTIVMTAPAKTFNTHGLYSSFHIIPSEAKRNKYMREYRDRHMDYMDMGMIVAAASYSKCDDYVEGMHLYIAENLMFVRKYLEENDIGVCVHDFHATYLVWLDFRKWNKTSAEINKLLREKGLSLSDGSQYGFKADGFMRMNIATQRSNISRAFAIIQEVYKQI